MTDHRLECLTVLRIARHGQSTHGSAVERMVHGNDLVIGTAVFQIGVFSGCLDGALHRFRTGIGEKDPIHAGYFFDLSCCFDGGHIIIIVGSVDHLVDLCFQCIVVCFVLISQCKYGYTRYKIQIFFTVYIIQIHTIALIQNDLVPVIGMQQIFFRFCNIFFHGVTHFIFPPHRIRSRYRYPD